jgi:hypothetical protein
MRFPLGAFALGCAALAAAALAGCGGGGGGETLTKAEFVAAGDQICKDAHAQFAALQKNPPDTASEAATLTQKLIDISNTELDRIRALNAPSDVQPALDRYLKAREQGIALLNKGLAAAQDENARAYAAAQAEITKGQVKRLKLAQAVGFDECSRPAASSSSSGARSTWSARSVPTRSTSRPGTRISKASWISSTCSPRIWRSPGWSCSPATSTTASRST